MSYVSNADDVSIFTVEGDNVLALVHTRDLDWTVVIKENEVNYSVDEFWSLRVL